MLTKNEKILIIDKNTIYMDDIAHIVDIARKNIGLVQERWHLETDVSMAHELVNVQPEEYIDLIFNEESRDMVRNTLMNPSSDLYVAPNRDNVHLYTDLGSGLVEAHPDLPLFILREESNTNEIKYYDRNYLTISDADFANYDSILSIVKTGDYKIIVVPDAETGIKLAKDLRDVSILYPTYRYNQTEFIPGFWLFKYTNLMDVLELENMIELLSFNPLGRYPTIDTAVG